MTRNGLLLARSFEWITKSQQLMPAFRGEMSHLVSSIVWQVMLIIITALLFNPRVSGMHHKHNAPNAML